MIRKVSSRRSRAELESLRQAMIDFAEEHHPLSVRALYYLMAQAQLVTKDDRGYRFVKEDSGKLREAGLIPFEWLTDESRQVIQIYTCDDLNDGLGDLAAAYRRNIWADQPRYVELWCEAKASISALTPLTTQWHVRLIPCGGFGSKAFLYECAQHLAGIEKPIHVVYVGDYDPSGLEIEADLGRRVRRYAPGVELDVHRVALTGEQVHDWGLPTRSPKQLDSRTAKFQDDRVAELEAIPPSQLRKMCGDAIAALVDHDALQATKGAEANDRLRLEEFIRGVN